MFDHIGELITFRVSGKYETRVCRIFHFTWMLRRPYHLLCILCSSKCHCDHLCRRYKRPLSAIFTEAVPCHDVRKLPEVYFRDVSVSHRPWHWNQCQADLHAQRTGSRVLLRHERRRHQHWRPQSLQGQSIHQSISQPANQLVIQTDQVWAIGWRRVLKRLALWKFISSHILVKFISCISSIVSACWLWLVAKPVLQPNDLRPRHRCKSRRHGLHRGSGHRL